MEKNTHSLNWLALGAELIDCLRSKGNHRLTRYDAFVWMMEHIQKGVAVRDADGIVVNSAPYSASYKRLAEDWNWERHTVQSFIEELTALSVITSKRQGNVYVFFIGKKSYKQLVRSQNIGQEQLIPIPVHI